MTIKFLSLFQVRIQIQTPLPVTWCKGCAASWVVLVKTHLAESRFTPPAESLCQLRPESREGLCLAHLYAHRALLSAGVSLQHHFSLGCPVVKASNIPLMLLNRQHNQYCLYIMRATSHPFLALSWCHAHQLHLGDTSTWASSENSATMSNATSTIKLLLEGLHLASLT